MEDENVPPLAPASKRTEHGMLLPIVFGQVLSFLVALAAVCTKMMYEEYAFSSPALQNTLGYSISLLCFTVPCLRFKIEWRHALAVFFVAVADSQAGFLGSLAYSYGVSIASVGMLSSFTIPCAMLFSYLFLKVRYAKIHFAGCGIALAGLVFVVLADVSTAAAGEDGPEAAPANLTIQQQNQDPVFGDFLIILGSAVYAAANVATEKFVKTTDIFVYLAWLCLFGGLISAIQFAILEQASIPRLQHEIDAGIWLFFLSGGVLFMLLYYSISKYIQLFDSVVFNLSLLTTDVWGIVFGVLLFNETVHALKFLGFAFVVVGVYVYNKQAPQRPEQQQQDGLEEGSGMQEGDLPNGIELPLNRA